MTINRRRLLAVLSLLALATIVLIASYFVRNAESTEVTSSAPSEPKEKQVTFYSTYGYLKDGQWIIPMRAWVHEPPDRVRWATASAIRSELAERAEIEELSEEEEAIFRRRAYSFIADSESRETVVFRFDDDPGQVDYVLDNGEGQRTDLNGLIEGFLAISESAINQLLENQSSSNTWLSLRAVSEDHEGHGRVRLVSPEGLSVISDIDDTIKVTEIPSGEREVLRNTFFRPFRATPCMLEHYEAYPADTSFHYVSGGPWQLYEALYDFVNEEAGFPEGTFHMKNVRTNLLESDSWRDLWKLVGGSADATFDQKVEQITNLLRRFPQRRFVLIGDSGERDPEVFATVRKESPGQVAEIIIRDVALQSDVDPRRFTEMTVVPPGEQECSAQ